MLLASSSSPKDILREEDVDVVVVVRRVAIRKLRAELAATDVCRFGDKELKKYLEKTCKGLRLQH